MNKPELLIIRKMGEFYDKTVVHDLFDPAAYLHLLVYLGPLI